MIRDYDYDSREKEIKREKSKTISYIFFVYFLFLCAGLIGFAIGYHNGESKVTSKTIETVLESEKKNKIQITTFKVVIGGIEKIDTIEYKIIE